MLQRISVETTKMDAADVEQSVDYAIETVLNELDAIFILRRRRRTDCTESSCREERCYFVAQCCVIHRYDWLRACPIASGGIWGTESF